MQKKTASKNIIPSESYEFLNQAHNTVTILQTAISQNNFKNIILENHTS